MLSKENFKDIITIALVIGLFILAIMIVKPVAYSIFFGILLAYIFYPLYKYILSKLKNENISAILICLGLVAIILFIVGFALSSLANQAIELYLYLQGADLSTTITQALPDFLSSEFSTTLANSINSFISNLLAKSLSSFTSFILNLPILIFQLIIVVFVFFFSLRDGKKAAGYIKSLSHLGKETQEKFFRQFKDITNSVLIGQIVIGILQGIVAGIGYFIFGVQNALILTLLTMLVGIIPLIGPTLVWIPVTIYLFIAGRTGAGIGLLLYGLVIISWIDVIVRPVIVSRKTELNSVIVIIGMVGGLFVFGVSGLIIGPLVLAYVLLVLELYRKKTLGQDLVFKKVEEPKIKKLI